MDVNVQMEQENVDVKVQRAVGSIWRMSKSGESGLHLGKIVYE